MTNPERCLRSETRTCLPTNEAAAHLGRRPRTLRDWAYRQSGPIAPIRVHGRLAWRTEDLRRLVGAEGEVSQ